MTKGFDLKGVPGTIDQISKRKGAPRKVDDVGQTQSSERTVTMLLDVSDDRFAKQLDEMFPGSRLMTKAMAEPRANGQQTSAATIRMAKKLPELALVCTDVGGDLIFKADIARVSGKPELRVAAGAERMEMPIKVKLSLPRPSIQKVDDAVGVDLIFNIAVVQMDTDDVVDEEKGDAKAPKKSKDKTPVQLTVVPDPEKAAE